ncbi:MAG: Hsp33 family molecular chaperone HslO [Steroidobacteraceae bacterium]
MVLPEDPSADSLRRFVFDSLPMRGYWLDLGPAWRELKAHQHHPAAVERLLGETLAASVLLAGTLKFDGLLTLQIEGSANIALLVAQCTHDYRMRAMVRVADVAGEGTNFTSLVGEGTLAVTIDTTAIEGGRYQGIVPLDGKSLAESLEHYFASSEQLPTRVLLAADANRCGGLILQRMPADSGRNAENHDGEWRLAGERFSRLARGQLLDGDGESLLRALAGSEAIRLFSPQPVRFRCRCDGDRVASLLQGLGREEVEDILREQGSVSVTCEFCQRPYRFDAGDVEQLFAGDHPPSGSRALN